jgi:DNA (cytosine-5)-methyltransferase 1
MEVPLMSRPVLLDLFCGAGGCAVGYDQAGFRVVGVDKHDQTSYPFEFVQADALAFARKYAKDYDAIHASPPCQKFSITAKIMEGKGIGNRKAVDLVGPTRDILRGFGLPYAIENVVGLRVIRHRAFECNFPVSAPFSCRGRHQSTGSHRGYSKGHPFVTVGGNNYNFREGMEAMGIYWMRNRPELSEAIPPAYTEYIGSHMIRLVTQTRSR